MRWIGALVVCTLALVQHGRAMAADDARQALFGAAFAETGLAAGPGLTGLSDAGSTARYIPGQGLARWSTTEVAAFTPAGAAYVDSVRVTAAGYDPRPGAALMRPGAGAFGPQALDVTYIRNWPSAFRVDAGGNLSLDITPHAGLGVSTGGGRSAEAGALVRFGSGLRDTMMRAVGMGGPPQERSRIYLFAGATARSLESNLAVGEGAVRRTDMPEDGVVQETRAGLGVGRGSVQALFGYTHEMTKLRAIGEDSRSDHRVGLTLSIR